MRNCLIVVALLILCSCRNEKGEEKDGKDSSFPVEKETFRDTIQREETRHYRDSLYRIGFKYPAGMEVYRGELMPNVPVINIYPEDHSQSPPFGIHEDPEISYIAVLPEGFGVDAPAGRRAAMKDWDGNPPVDFTIDPAESRVYFLESGEPWAYSLRFYDNLENWKDYGSIFVRLGVKNFRTTCEEREDGEEVKMEDCDPLAGDIVKYYGEIKKEESNLILETLQSIYFFSPDREREEISDLIRITEPVDNQLITSPLQIKGEARGYWFFEADAPFMLINDENEVLARGSITAQGDWMTEDFVPFNATVRLDPLDSEEGSIVFLRSNASGLPEHDRSYRLPVRFK